MGMIIDVILNMIKKPFTSRYPYEKTEVAKRYRGKLLIDRKKCIGCRLCEINCPTGAIVVNKKSKKAEVDAGLCIFCSLCAEVCPVKCITFSNKYENTVNNRKKLKPKKR